MNQIRSGAFQENRDHKGKFTSGTSGNPAGRPPGIKDKRVSVTKDLLEPLLPETIERLAEKVSKGERWAIEAVLRYCLPKPKPIDPVELQEFEQRLEQLERKDHH